MNQAHLHLMINHLPIMGTVIGTIILISGYIINNPIVKRTALGVFILACLGIIPARTTGEGAEEIVEELPGASLDLIHEHEDFAGIFGWSLLAVALLSLITFYLDIKNKSNSKFLYLFVVASALLTIWFAKQTATSGGEIQHTEIRDGATGQIPNSGGNKVKEDND